MRGWYDARMMVARGQRRCLILFLFLLMRAAPVDAAAVDAPDVVRMRPRGEIRERLRLAARNLGEPGKKLATDMGWGADQYARWIEAVDWLASALEESTTVTAVPLAEFYAHQRPDGSPFMSGLNPREVWGATRALLWLARRAKADPGDARAREAALRLGAFFARPGVVPERRDTRVQAGPLAAIEGLVVLARATGRPEFLATAERMAAVLDDSMAAPGPRPLVEGPEASRVIYTERRAEAFEPHEHQTHTFLEATLGLVDLFTATGDSVWLDQACRVQAATLRESQWVSGGVSELFGEPFEYNDETCAVVSWLRLNLKLAESTGRSGYWDVAEATLLNHLYFDQASGGGFCADRSITRALWAAHNYPGVVTDECCSMHGARGMLEALEHAVALSDRGVDVRLYLEGDVSVTTRAGERLQFRLAGAYTDSGTVRLSWTSPPRAALRLRFRRPRWLEGEPEIRVNGRPVAAAREEGYLVVTRAWRRGDVVSLRWPWRLSIVESGRNGFNAPRLTRADANSPEILHDAALLYGPSVLMTDWSLNGAERISGEFALALFRSVDGTLHLPRARSTTRPASPLVHAAARFSAAATPISTSPTTPAARLAALRGAGTPWRALTLSTLSETTVPHEGIPDPWRVRQTLVLLPEAAASRVLPRRR